MGASQSLESAFVLHQYAWSESSLIVDLFTRQQGRVAVLAKGAKRPYSQFRSILLPFQSLSVSLRAPREASSGEVQTLRSVEWQGSGLMLRSEALLAGFYINELVLKLLPRQDAQPTLFDVYAQTLVCLDMPAHASEVPAALRAFELVLLREHGVLPALDRVMATQQRLDPDKLYSLDPAQGLCLTHIDQAAALSGHVWCLIEKALVEQEWSVLRQLCSLGLNELKVLLRVFIQHGLGYQTLATRQLMLELAQV